MFDFFFPSRNLLFSAPKNHLFNPFCLTYLSWTCNPCCATCPRLVRVCFCPETIYFCLGSSSIYFKMNFNNSFFTFEIFFFLKYLVFRVHGTSDAPKIEKIQLSRNLTKIFWVTRFRKKNLTVSPFCHLRSRKISGFPEQFRQFYRFCNFSEKLNFSRVLHSSPLNRISSPKFTHTSTHNHMHMLQNRTIFLPIGARVETYPNKSTDLSTQYEV